MHDITKLIQELKTKTIYDTSMCVNIRLKPDVLKEVDDLINSIGCTRGKFLKAAIQFYIDTLKNKNDEYGNL